MNKVAVTILVSVLLSAPHVASAKGRKAKSTRHSKRAHASRRYSVSPSLCPPPIIQITKPDSVEAVSYENEAQLQASVAAWLNSTQPPMSEAATNAARNIATFWFRRGRASVK